MEQHAQRTIFQAPTGIDMLTERALLACPTCGAPNSELEDACSYCGTFLRKQ